MNNNRQSSCNFLQLLCLTSNNQKQRNEEIIPENLCASFQNSVTEVLVNKTFRLAKEMDVKQIIVAGGVSANKGLKERFTAENPGFEICIPSIKYCTDNAAMIAIAGYYQYQKYQSCDGLDMNASASLDLESFYLNK